MPRYVDGFLVPIPRRKVKEYRCNMPFDARRMAYGGFKVIVDL